MPKYDYREKALEQLCYGCYKYRSLDGTGNNKDHPEWGAAGEPFTRLAPSEYDDGLNTPRGGEGCSGPLPSAREVSNVIFNQPCDIFDKHHLNNLFWCWGQFIDHNITLTETTSVSFNICVPEGDPWFDPSGTGNVTIPLNRSEFVGGNSADGPREQINSIDSYINANMVYGTDKKRNSYLRSYCKGRLKTSNGGLLPLTDGKYPNAGPPAGAPFLAGDVRANEHLGLCALHTIFVSEHNYWADKICKRCPKLCDEDIYQRAKLMVEAEIQEITYGVWLKILLGKFPCYKGYDPEVNATLSNEFATAAFRVGHPMVSSKIYKKDNLKDTFFSSWKICNKEYSICSIIDSFINTRQQKINAKVVTDLRCFLFGKPGQGGLDLAALNMQRGRDSGLANYNAIRVILGLPPITDFNPNDEFDKDFEKLASLYSSVNDVDLWVGGLSEKPVYGSLMGPTFTKIIKEQFMKIRDGDSFWYERRLPKDLVKLVKRTTLASILRRNTCCIDIPDDVFYVKKRCTCKRH